MEYFPWSTLITGTNSQFNISLSLLSLSMSESKQKSREPKSQRKTAPKMPLPAATPKVLANTIRNEISSRQYANHGWFNTVLSSLNETGNQDALRAHIDPGHSASVLMSADPLPTSAVGVNIYSTPSIATYTITVPAGTEQFVYSTVEPSVAFATYVPGAQAASAYPTSHSVVNAPYLPARHMEVRGYMGVRCTAKSLTIENISPVINRGGYCLAKRYAGRAITQNSNFASPPPALVTSSNQRFYWDTPLSAVAFEASASYERFSSDGVYMVASLRSDHFDMNTIDKGVSQAFGSGKVAVPCNSNIAWLVDPYTTLGAYPVMGVNGAPLVWAPDTVDTDNANGDCYLSGLDDQTTIVCALLRAPAEHDQTFTVKFHARYEYIVDSASPDYIKSVPSNPSMGKFDEVMVLAAAMPGVYEASYNAGGKVWEAFKKGISWIATNILKPTLGAALGGFKGAVVTALSK